MLNIYLGEMKEAIYHPPTYFDNRYEDEWITDPLSVKMIKDVDKDQIVHNMEEFAAEVRGSDNYFVLITRENLYNLPYSVEEIYGLYASGRYQNTKKIYQQMYRIYSDIQELPIKPELFIDSKKYFSWERFFTNLQISSLSFALC